MQRIFLSSTLVALALSPLMAADEAPPEAPAEEAPEVSYWSHEAKLGGYLSNVAVGKAETSRDATIGGAQDTITYIFIFDGKLVYDNEPNEIEQTLKLNFGRQKQEDTGWIENSDLIDYDGVYKRKLDEPHYLYGAWGADSIFTGAPPEEEPLDPVIGKVSAGYGQKHQFTEKELFEGRIGARAQKRWGRGIGEAARDIETGIELYLRYEDSPTEDLKYYAQFEAFSEFDDLGHIQNLLQAGLSYQLHKYVSLEFGLRAYYETEPDDAAPGATGYDEISFRQETTIGIIYKF